MLVTSYVCEDDDWHLEGTDCVKGEMPPRGDGCEEGTTDRIGEDGFCHHYQDAKIEYSCSDGAKLEGNKCMVKEVAK